MSDLLLVSCLAALVWGSQESRNVGVRDSEGQILLAATTINGGFWFP